MDHLLLLPTLYHHPYHCPYHHLDPSFDLDLDRDHHGGPCLCPCPLAYLDLLFQNDDLDLPYAPGPVDGRPYHPDPGRDHGHVRDPFDDRDNRCCWTTGDVVVVLDDAVDDDADRCDGPATSCRCLTTHRAYRTLAVHGGGAAAQASRRSMSTSPRCCRMGRRMMTSRGRDHRPGHADGISSRQWTLYAGSVEAVCHTAPHRGHRSFPWVRPGRARGCHSQVLRDRTASASPSLSTICVPAAVARKRQMRP
mmetsp:Transcript_9998/g.24480  ORF Transcript_9998/g.24480 Transcript_9998/m.24480 type:complete len:251 (-) Transcript_9998:1943-2695(-)